MPTYLRYKKIDKGNKSPQRHRGYDHLPISENKIMEMRHLDGWNYVMVDMPEPLMKHVVSANSKFDGEMITEADWLYMKKILSERVKGVTK